jgi:hypothetical protein
MLCGDDGNAYQCGAHGNATTKVMDCVHGCTAGACNTCTPGVPFCDGQDLSACDATGNAGSTSIGVGASAVIDVTGEGGAGLPAGGGATGDLPAGGGGAGGTLVIETSLLVTSAGAALSANGGGGGGGCFTCVGAACTHANGQPGPRASGRATPGTCSSGGNGGFAANGVANPSPVGQDTTSTAFAGGGGGGGDGVIILHARDTSHIRIAAGTVISPPATWDP